jgi:polyisoprenoid-binding protein YceI
MSTHASNSVGAPGLETTVWRIDPDRSTVEFRAKTFWGLATVKGRFACYHGTLDLPGKPAIELTIEADSELESVTVADHRRLGMNWNQLGMLRGPSRLMVSGRLVRDA